MYKRQVEYLLDVLLFGETEEKAALITDYGKDVIQLEQRMAELEMCIRDSNMERPDLQRMLRAIERRQVNLVITKDLSRLGRNYLQTGHLIEDFFPRNGVRYIAMNDGIDTLRDNNDIAPFKNILNEMYSKDISKKVHSSYLLKAQKGQFTGCLAPFGYRKDPEDRNHLLIDEETAPIVRLIFGYALNGHGPNYICLLYTS